MQLHQDATPLEMSPHPDSHTATEGHQTTEDGLSSVFTPDEHDHGAATLSMNITSPTMMSMSMHPPSHSIYQSTTAAVAYHQHQAHAYAQAAAAQATRLSNLTMLSEVGKGNTCGVLSDHQATAAMVAYFQNDPDAAAALGMSTFAPLVDAERPLSANAPTPTQPTGTRISRKRKPGSNVSIDLQTKIRLIELAEEYQYDPKMTSARGPSGSTTTTTNHMSGIRLAAQFGLNKSTVSRILKRKEEFKKAYYKDNISGGSKHINKKSKFEKLNRLVENWFDVTREKNVIVSDTLIRDVGKRFAEELGIEDFRGSNGWVRSLRNRKEHQVRSLSIEAMEREQRKKEAEAIERMRVMFPNGMKDVDSFFKDMTIYLEKDGIGLGLSGARSSKAEGKASVSYVDLMHDDGNENGNGLLLDPEQEAEEFLRKKMVESFRMWAQELMELELLKMKKRLKPRQQQQLEQQKPLEVHTLAHSTQASQETAII